jgi:hypothetical protein
MEVINITQEAMGLIIKLIVQDEDDRSSLSLIGVQSRTNELDVRTTTNSRKKYIEVDPQCLSCSGNP